MERFIVARKRAAPKASEDADEGSKKARTEGPERPEVWLATFLPEHWRDLLRDQCALYKFGHLSEFLRRSLIRRHQIYPPIDEVFNALRYCRLATPGNGGERGQGAAAAAAEVSVVILGQDPYPNAHGSRSHAHGLSFSVAPGVPAPPSLINVFAEVRNDLAAAARPVDFAPTTGCLSGWARQGVLLLNTCLTVKAREPRSHADKGWEPFTDGIIKLVSERSARPVVFMLWGRDAQSKTKLIDQNRHLVLMAAHPSPRSATDGFFGCRHFTKANAFLAKHNRRRIDWTDLSHDPKPEPDETDYGLILGLEPSVPEPAEDEVVRIDPPKPPPDENDPVVSAPHV